MTQNSTRLSVSPIGRVVAGSTLHPSSVHQLLEYLTQRGSELLSLVQDEDREFLFFFAILHAVYSSKEYDSFGNGFQLPYQLGRDILDELPGQCEEYLIERPWSRNLKSANAALLGVRWVSGEDRRTLSRDYGNIGSGVLQTMFQQGTNILFSLSDCLSASSLPHIGDYDRPKMLRKRDDLLPGLRSLASIIRENAIPLSLGLPGDVSWIGGLEEKTTGRKILSRHAVLQLKEKGLFEPLNLLRHETYQDIIEALIAANISDPGNKAQELRTAVREYRIELRDSLWKLAIASAPEELKEILRQMRKARDRQFENVVERLLKAVGMAYERLDDGKIAGAPDFRIGLNHRTQIVVELKTTANLVNLNSATDVVKGAAIVGLDELPMVTLANPGFDPNVPWQARKIERLTLVEACVLACGISRLARGDIQKESFLKWLTRPGMLELRALIE